MAYYPAQFQNNLGLAMQLYNQFLGPQAQINKTAQETADFDLAQKKKLAPLQLQALDAGAQEASRTNYAQDQAKKAQEDTMGFTPSQFQNDDGDFSHKFWQELSDDQRAHVLGNFTNSHLQDTNFVPEAWDSWVSRTHGIGKPLLLPSNMGMLGGVTPIPSMGTPAPTWAGPPTKLPELGAAPAVNPLSGLSAPRERAVFTPHIGPTGTTLEMSRDPIPLDDNERKLIDQYGPAAVSALPKNRQEIGKQYYDLNFAKQNNEEQRASGLLKDFSGEKAVQNYLSARQSYGAMKTIVDASRKDPTGADDMALIYSFMHALDPGSTVREGEYATAQNAAGLTDKIRNSVNKVLDGQKLGQSQREAFLKAAGHGLSAHQTTAEEVRSRYSEMAKRLGLPDKYFASFDNVEGGAPGAGPSGVSVGKQLRFGSKAELDAASQSGLVPAGIVPYYYDSARGGYVRASAPQQGVGSRQDVSGRILQLNPLDALGAIEEPQMGTRGQLPVQQRPSPGTLPNIQPGPQVEPVSFEMPERMQQGIDRNFANPDVQKRIALRALEQKIEEGADTLSGSWRDYPLHTLPKKIRGLAELYYENSGIRPPTEVK